MSGYLTLSDTPFSGSTSRPATTAILTTNCVSCGSSLVKRRVETVTVGATLVDVYRCRCGTRRHVKHEAAVA